MYLGAIMLDVNHPILLSAFETDSWMIDRDLGNMFLTFGDQDNDETS